tara:strand:+ start:1627 stop:2589 length:963 start_codon:yes stop_codon:yes gene_type:complete
MSKKRKKAAQAMMSKEEMSAMRDLFPFLTKEMDFKKEPDELPSQIEAKDLVPPAFTRGDKRKGEVVFEDLEDQRVKAFLGKRAGDPKKVKEFKDFRKKTAKSYSPRKIKYSDVEATPSKSEGSTMFTIMKPPPMTDKRLPPSYFRKPEQRQDIEVQVKKSLGKDFKEGVQAHEFGHVLDLIRPNYARSPIEVKKERRIGDSYLDKRQERLQFTVTPIKAAVRNIFGSVPTNKKELDEMREAIRKNPDMQKDIVQMATDFMPQIDKTETGEKQLRRMQKMGGQIEELIKYELGLLLKGDDEMDLDFLRAAKAKTKKKSRMA